MMGEYLKLNILDNIYIDKNDFSNRTLPFSVSELIQAPVKTANILTQGDDVKTVFHLSLPLTDKNDYLPGDTIGIIPKNDEEEVCKLLCRLNLESVADNEFNLSILEDATKKNPTIPKHIPKVGSIRSIFLNNIDIRNPPKKLFLKALIKYTSDVQEIETLKLLTSSTGTKYYSDFISSTGKTLLRLLLALPRCNPSLEIILEHSVILQARPYSISSSPLLNDSVHITFFVLRKDDGSSGVCTGWLKNIISQNNSALKIPFYFRKSNSFRIISDFTLPIIMIGTGTGIAPFYGFLQHKYLIKQNKFEDIAESWLFHGCRYSNRDALYKNEINKFLKKGVLSRYYICPSRDSKTKLYVQHKIKEIGEEFINLIINKSAVTYICGDFKTVIRDVKNTILEMLIMHGNLSEEDAKTYFSMLEKNKKIIIDSWI